MKEYTYSSSLSENSRLSRASSAGGATKAGRLRPTLRNLMYFGRARRPCRAVLARICVFQQAARIAIVAVGLTLSGCGKPETKPAGIPPEKGTLQTAVEGFTGKTAVDYGLKAKDQIKKANEKELRDRNEAME